jgi:predicted dehydrogenase
MPRPTYPFGDGGRGQYAFIGAVHRIAAHIDDRFELIAGALSSTPERSQASGEAIDLSRIYDDFKQMAMREARRKDGIEAVAIVTPSHVHYAVAREYLKRGVHVICDRPPRHLMRCLCSRISTPDIR